MQDPPLPTPPPSPVDRPAPEGGSPGPTEAIQAQANGVPSSPHVISKPLPPPPPQPTLRDWVVYRLVQLGALAGLWAVLLLFLWKFLNFEFANALGFAIILALIASFFLRSLLPIQSPADKYPPPPVEPDEPGETGLAGEVRQMLGWWAGLVLVLVCGWGAIIGVGIATRSLPVDFDQVVGVASLVSLGIFLLLERNFWLSRLMGLRVWPGLPWWGSAVIFWMFGIPGLLFRSTAARPRPAAGLEGRVRGAEPLHAGDSIREIIETVVFVVVLVLMLKSFVAEAFVIPTGSMAETLYGYQKIVECPACGVEFPVNCSAEVDPSDERPAYVSGCTCPNCRQRIRLFLTHLPDGAEVPEKALKDYEDTHPSERAIFDKGPKTGDRVLVSKFVYDLAGKLPNRLDVVVFKFPGDQDFPARSGPVKKHSPMNYIKRLIGLPGETIAIRLGKLYVLSPDRGLSYPDHDQAKDDPSKLAQLWRLRYTHRDDQKARDLFEQGQFEILRKPPDVLLAMMRLVYDNDHPARDLTEPGYQRWRPAEDSGWSSAEKNSFQHDGSGADLGWLRYRHVLRGNPDRPQLITDFMGYNTWEAAGAHAPPNENWATDLIVECNVKVESPEGVFALELSRGPDRFQARFDLKTGTCDLVRKTGKAPPVTLKSAPTRMNGKGTYKVRFANVDERLTVWVDGRLPFDDGVEYKVERGRKLVPVKENDLDRPVSVGAWARVKINGLKIFRDTYYTTARSGAPSNADVPEFDPADPDKWKHVEDAPVTTYYVQPDHFLCLGDNSPESSDGRTWGLVPRRLMLGRALLVYYPFKRGGRIR